MNWIIKQKREQMEKYYIFNWLRNNENTSSVLVFMFYAIQLATVMEKYYLDSYPQCLFGHNKDIQYIHVFMTIVKWVTSDIKEI